MEKAVFNRMEPQANNRVYPDFKINRIRKEEQDRMIAILVSDFGFTFKEVKELKRKLNYFERG